MDSHKRSLVKTITWRVVATTVTILVSYIWLGEWGSAFALAITANAIKSLLYYLHERGWNRMNFGRREGTGDECNHYECCTESSGRMMPGARR